MLWQSNEHFLPGQDFQKDYDKTVYESLHGPGVINGCRVTVVSGLTVQIAAGLVLFDNGELCKIEQQEVTLAAADPTNPRIDRIELAFTFENNVQVTNTVNVVKQFDKLSTGTGGDLTGTPAGSPVIDVKTAGAVSLASVNVAATQTVLSQSDIAESDVVREPSTNKKASETQISVPTSTSGQEDITDLIADLNQFRQVSLDYQIRRKTDTASSGVVNAGTLHIFLNPETNLWDFSDDRNGNDDVLVDFNVVAATGQVQWDVTAIAGANPIGSFTFTKRTLDI